jgi:hypothetical protein
LVAAPLLAVDSLHTDLNRSEQKRQERIAARKQRLGGLRTRVDQLYEDKLDGKITEEFWARKQAEYSDQERSLETALSSLNRPITPERVLTVARTFELVQKGSFSVRYAKSRGKRPIAEKRAFELRHGWRKSLAQIQKAL